MMWDSVADFWAMGGYGFYVWMSFGLCLLLMIVEPYFVSRHKKQVIKRIQQQLIAHRYQKERK